MPVVVRSEALALADAGTPAPAVVSQSNSREAVVADDEVALVESEANTPLMLGTIDLAVVTSETILVL